MCICLAQTVSPPGAGFGGSAESDLGTVAQHGPQGAATASLSADSSTEGCFHGSCVQPQVLISACCHSLLVKEAPSHTRPRSLEPRGQISETLWSSQAQADVFYLLCLHLQSSEVLCIQTIQNEQLPRMASVLAKQ